MKNILILFILNLSFSCSAFEYEMPGYRFSNFENTEVSDLANAVKENDAKKVKQILSSNKINVDFKDPKFQKTLLSLAIVNQKQNTIIELLKAGANPNELLGTLKDETPFINAVRYTKNCNLFYVETLLEYGANPNLEIENPKKNHYFDNSFALLVSINNWDENNDCYCLNLVKLLIDKGSNINYCYKPAISEICEGVITESLMAKNMDALRYFVIEKNITIPDTVIIYGGINKKTQKVYGLGEILNSEHFTFEDFQDESGKYTFSKQRKIRDEILAYLDNKKIKK